MTNIATKNINLTFSQTCHEAIRRGIDTVAELMSEFDLTRSMARRVLDAINDDRRYYGEVRL